MIMQGPDGNHWNHHGFTRFISISLPSGKLLHNYGKSPSLDEQKHKQLTISTGPWLQQLCNSHYQRVFMTFMIHVSLVRTPGCSICSRSTTGGREPHHRGFQAPKFGIFPSNMAWKVKQYLHFGILKISHWSIYQSGGWKWLSCVSRASP